MVGKVLVTGSSGVIGTHLCNILASSAIPFIGLDIRPNKWSNKVNDLTIRGDIRAKETFDKLPDDVEIIVHLAANSRVYEMLETPSLALDNFTTLHNVLEYSRANKINKVIFSSSREVYGNVEKAYASESNSEVALCESPYAASKLGGEAIINAYNNCFNLDYLIFRFSNVYGMYDESDRVIPVFLKKINMNETIEIYGSEKILDFVHIDDTVSAIKKGIVNFENVKNDVFNIASGMGTSIGDLAKLIQGKMNTNVQMKIKGNRSGEVMRFVGDIRKANNILGYIPKVGIDEGISKTIDWYSRNQNSILYNEVN